MEDKNSPFISIIIPCRNEEKYIGKCLDSIIAQDYPKEKLKVLLVDGRSVKIDEHLDIESLCNNS